MSAQTDYVEVSEVAGQPMTSEQLDRLWHRYLFARDHCVGRDVVEVACGSGPGLGLLRSVSRSLEAGDFSPAMVDFCRNHYRDRIHVARFDAQALPFDDASKDVIICFEALYYIPDVNKFFAECRRVLRSDGLLLLASANRDLTDFNPSPHSHVYLGVRELTARLAAFGFRCSCFGYLSVETTSARQRVLRPIKRLAVASGLMPKTMKGKEALKRLVFGKLAPMPAELDARMIPAYTKPLSIPNDMPDYRHKVIYCVAESSNRAKSGD